MKRSWLKFQLVGEAVLLLATLVLVSTILYRYNYRWDLTHEKVYSLPKTTANVLKDLKGRRLDVYVFVLRNDERIPGLEIFFQECQRYHPDFRYGFYDPNRRPKFAEKFQVTEPSTVVIKSGDRKERIAELNDETFTNAFLRILHPQNIGVCFVQGHGEVEINSPEQIGYSKFRETLEGYNASVSEIVLSRDHVPPACQVVVLSGPRWEIPKEELNDLKRAFRNGTGLLFLLDPMDPGTGQIYISFAKEFGVALGRNVIVDKTSRIVGGDFLMPLVSRYFMEHPVSQSMKLATLFPLVRSVQPSTDIPSGLEVTPLAMTNPESWAETDLIKLGLEKGEANFEIEVDVAGPLPVAVAVESEEDQGESDSEKRMVIVGDSDFLNNSYISLAGNKQFGVSIIRWLARDDRFVEVQKPHFKFKALLLSVPNRSFLIFTVLGVYPLIFFVFGGLYFVIRSRTS